MNLYRTLDGEPLALPGVRSVGRTSAGPLFGGVEPDQILPAEQAGTGGTGQRARWYDISPSFFETLGVPVLRGRALTREDNMEAPMVAVVNETLADRLWPGEDPLGREIWLEMHDGIRQVVGVVADVHISF